MSQALAAGPADDARTVEVGPYRFHLLDVGTGPAVLLLHGFPSSSYLWRHQIPALVGAGYRVLAPDLRGFGESAKPARVADYTPTRLLGDVLGIMSVAGVRRAHVVGHDFGAALAWMLASLMPHRVDHLVAMSVGHPMTFADQDLEQRRRGWYVLLFQLPEAEQVLRRGNWRLLREMYADEVDGERMLADLRRPGALTPALNWYRAMRHPAHEHERARPLPPIDAPTLAVWGERDPALTEAGMLGSRAFVRGRWRYERLAGAGHFLPVDAPDRVNELLLDFLGPATTPIAPAFRHRRR